LQVQFFLERGARRAPDKTALVAGDQRLTYRQLNERCDRLAHSLQAHNLRRGDRVVILLENSAEAVYAIFAALKADAVFVMVNPTTKADKLAYILNDCAATMVVTDVRRQGLVRQLLPRLPHLRVVAVAGRDVEVESGDVLFVALDALIAGEELRTPVSRGIDVDLAALIYTSGSTGEPKGVMMTHLNIVSAARSITTYLENTADDVILNVLPLSFDYGLYQVLMAFRVGATVILERSFTYAHPVLETVVRERVTGFPIVPTIAALLLQLDLEKYDFSSLRYITSTGDVLPTPHIERLRQLFPHVVIYSMYGLTECKRVSYLPPDQVEARPTSVGRGMPNQEVYVADADGRRLTNGVGELVVRGANVMQGYWQLSDATNRMLKPGSLPGQRVLHTGDRFRMEDGFLYFVGRTDDIIKTRGEKVSPKEIENVLHALAGVAQAAVVGVPDPILGQAVKAFVVPTAGANLTEQDVWQHCRQHLEDFMVPHVVEFRDAIPKTASGKVQRQLLRLESAGAVESSSPSAA